MLKSNISVTSPKAMRSIRLPIPPAIIRGPRSVECPVFPSMAVQIPQRCNDTCNWNDDQQESLSAHHTESCATVSYISQPKKSPKMLIESPTCIVILITALETWSEAITRAAVK